MRMDRSFYDPLPENVRTLVDDLERFGQREIEVARNPYPENPADPNPRGPGAQIHTDDGCATIFYYDSPVPAQGMLHELLHIRRYWVDAVPQLVPRAAEQANLWRITSSIEGALEHLVIVPSEEEYGFERFDHWNRTVAAGWSRIEATQDDPVLPVCLIGWLSARFLVNDKAVRQLVHDAIERAGHAGAAGQFATRIRGILLSSTTEGAAAQKLSALRATVRAVQQRPEDFELVFVDPAARASARVPLG